MIVASRNQIKPGDVLRLRDSNETYTMADLATLPRGVVASAIRATETLVPLLDRHGDIVVVICTQVQVLTPLEALAAAAS